MGRKQKRGSKQSTIPHKEAFMRMNYLLQVRQLLFDCAHAERCFLLLATGIVGCAVC